MVTYEMFVAVVVLMIGVLVHIILTDVFKFRNITSRRYLRVMLLGVFGWFTTGGLSFFLWVVFVLYGIYVLITSILGYILGAGSKGFGISNIIYLVLGYVLTGKVIDHVEKKNGNRNIKEIIQEKAKKAVNEGKVK